MSNQSKSEQSIDTLRRSVDGIDLPPLPELPETPYLLAKDSLPYESGYISERGWEDDAVREYATAYAAAAVAAERERCARICDDIAKRHLCSGRYTSVVADHSVRAGGQVDGAEECAAAIRGEQK
jgi:hypothetical protein